MKILISAGNSLISNALIYYLKSLQINFNCIASKNGDEAVKMYFEQRPDVVVMEIFLQKQSGFKVASDILMDDVNAKIILISSENNMPLISECYKLGIKGIVKESNIEDELHRALAAVWNGKYFYPVAIEELILCNEKYKYRQLLINYPEKILTKRECAIYNYFGNGLTIHKIAEMLGISKKTVENHVYTIKKKLKLTSTNELICVSNKFDIC